jgi:hypothetical protein
MIGRVCRRAAMSPDMKDGGNTGFSTFQRKRQLILINQAGCGTMSSATH